MQRTPRVRCCFMLGISSAGSLMRSVGRKHAMSTAPPSWKAEFEGNTLHISGTTRYPNDFSTASLERVDSHSGSEVVSYRVVFHRDKEPFCGPDLIGPVHHFERHLLAGTVRIRVTVG